MLDTTRTLQNIAENDADAFLIVAKEKPSPGSGRCKKARSRRWRRSFLFQNVAANACASSSDHMLGLLGLSAIANSSAAPGTGAVRRAKSASKLPLVKFSNGRVIISQTHLFNINNLKPKL